jgi:tRNA isopentenyl-2-thiomethyl-A-37 hydroxylase MiaE
MLKKAPYKVSYADFTYTVQPVELPEEKTSYIAARMIMANGRLCQPLHEYELTKRFTDLAEAEAAWTGGFEAKGDQFVSRAIIERMIDEQAAELIAAPGTPLSVDVSAG